MSWVKGSVRRVEKEEIEACIGVAGQEMDRVRNSL